MENLRKRRDTLPYQPIEVHMALTCNFPYGFGTRSYLNQYFSNETYPEISDEEFIYEFPNSFMSILLYAQQDPVLLEMTSNDKINFSGACKPNPSIYRQKNILETSPMVMFLRSQAKPQAGPVMEDLGMLLQNESISVSAQEVAEAMDRVDELFTEHENEEIPGELLQQLDQVGARLELKAGTGQLVRPNFAMAVAGGGAEENGGRVRGVRMAAGFDHGFADDMFEFCHEDDGTPPRIFSNETSAVALLPPSVAGAGHRVSFLAFRTDRAFQDHSCQLNSWVVSVSVDNFTGFQDGEMIEIYLNPTKKAISRDQEAVCAYWHFEANGTGHWSQDGCELIVSEEGLLDLCRCNHLTHFAQIIIRREVFSELNEKILEIISVVGCSLSIFGIAIIGLTAALFKSWRTQDSNKVWLHLCSAVLCLNICFLVTIYVPFTQSDVTCTVIGIALHYSVLATFCWMLVVTVLSYRKLVLVFTTDIRYKLLVSSLFSWGFPMLIIGILLAVSPRSYSQRYEDITPNGAFCYPKGIAFWITLLLPIGIIWLVNWCLFAIIIKTINDSKRMQKHINNKAATLRTVSVSCLLAFVCGIPWVFGFFARNIVAAYLFTLTVTFQGFVLFLFFIVGIGSTRRQWMALLSRGARGLRVTSSGATSRSQPTSSTPLNPSDSSTIPLRRSKFYVKSYETSYINPPQKSYIRKEELVSYQQNFCVIVELGQCLAIEYASIPSL